VACQQRQRDAVSKRIASVVFEILRLRAGPQELPASRPLLFGALAAMALADAIGLAHEMGLGRGLLAGTFDALLLAGFVYLVLRVRGFATRIWQTLPALALIGAVLSLAAQLVITLVPSRDVAGVLWWMVLIWYLAASGHVLRHALDVPWYGGAAISFLYLLFFWSVLQFLLGSPPSGAS